MKTSEIGVHPTLKEEDIFRDPLSFEATEVPSYPLESSFL
jgi:hypothetical protein